MTHYCPSCGEPAVPPRGNKESKVLLIGEFPGEVEMDRGKPFAGPAGGVLKSELFRCGVDFHNLRIMNLWLHAQTADEKCFKAGYDLVLEEAKGKDAILMVGSEVVSTFTKYSVSDICGLLLDKSDHPFSAKTVMAMVNPAIVFHRGIGEVRMAIQKFTKALNERHLLDDVKMEDLDEDEAVARAMEEINL